MTLPVCVVIVSYNRVADLRVCLASLQRQQPAVARVMVVDNGSTDGTLAMVQAEHPWVELFKASGNLGPCVARNAAAAESGEALLWFLDSDTEMMVPDAAARMVALFDRPEVQAAGGEAVLDAAGAVVGTKRLRLTRNAMVQGDTVLGDMAANKGSVSPCRVIASCNLMMRRTAFARLGGFDPFYFFFYEDMDLSYRASALGPLLALAPMPVVHRYSESVRISSLWPESRNRMYFILKNLPAWQFLLLPVLDVATMVRVDSLARLLRRSRQGGSAVSLVTLSAESGSTASAAKAWFLVRRMATKLLMAYAAIPGVIGPALAARRRVRDGTVALPPHDPALLRRLPAFPAPHALPDGRA